VARYRIVGGVEAGVVEPMGAFWLHRVGWKVIRGHGGAYREIDRGRRGVGGGWCGRSLGDVEDRMGGGVGWCEEPVRGGGVRCGGWVGEGVGVWLAVGGGGGDGGAGEAGGWCGRGWGGDEGGTRKTERRGRALGVGWEK